MTDPRNTALSGNLLYLTPAGRRGFVPFASTGSGLAPVYDGQGRVQFTYLAADGGLPNPISAKPDWQNPADLTVAGLLPGLLDASHGEHPNPGECAWCAAFDDDRDTMNVCSTCRADERDDPDACTHDDTRHAEAGEPYQRECTECGARLYLTDAQNTIMAIRDDGAYYVTSIDGSDTYAGPFLDWNDANDAAEQVESDRRVIETDIRFERR